VIYFFRKVLVFNLIISLVCGPVYAGPKINEIGRFEGALEPQYRDISPVAGALQEESGLMLKFRKFGLDTDKVSPLLEELFPSPTPHQLTIGNNLFHDLKSIGYVLTSLALHPDPNDENIDRLNFALDLSNKSTATKKRLIKGIKQTKNKEYNEKFKKLFYNKGGKTNRALGEYLKQKNHANKPQMNKEMQTVKDRLESITPLSILVGGEYDDLIQKYNPKKRQPLVREIYEAHDEAIKGDLYPEYIVQHALLTFAWKKAQDTDDLSQLLEAMGPLRATQPATQVGRAISGAVPEFEEETEIVSYDRNYYNGLKAKLTAASSDQLSWYLAAKKLL